MAGSMFTTFIALVQAIAQPAAPAQPPAQPPATIVAEPAALFIAACDGNADAQVSQAELTACIAHALSSADGAAGGSIGYIAYADWCLRWLGDRNALPSPFEVDTDADNRITLAELQARFAGYFRRFDTDGNGRLSRAELVTIRSRPQGDDTDRRKSRR